MPKPASRLGRLPGLLSAVVHAPERLRRITSTTRYVPQIDGLRFLAIVPVLFWHATLRGVRAQPHGDLLDFVTHGHVGVYLFFFISGYIIAFPFMSGKPPTLGVFYRRRLLRLEPPYFLVMIVCFLVLSTGFNIGTSPSRGMLKAPLWESLAASLAYAHGLVFGTPPALNPPAWSLEIEIQFYLAAPFLFAAYLRVADPRRRLWLAGAVVALSLLAAEVLLANTRFESPWRHTLILYGWMFFVGVASCDWAVRAQPFLGPARRESDIGLVSGLAGLYLAGLIDSDRMQVAAPVALLRDLGVVGCLLLVYLGAARGIVGRRVLGAPWIALIGGACYSLYLTQVPLIHAFSTVVFHIVPAPSSQAAAVAVVMTTALPAAIVGGLVFYALVERPCTDHQWPRKLLRHLGWPRQEPEAGS